jgi:hypothetical protein
MKKSYDKALGFLGQYGGTRLLLAFLASVGLWQVCGMRQAAMLEVDQASSSNAYVAFTVLQHENCTPGVLQ